MFFFASHNIKNQMLERRLRVHVNVILKNQTEHENAFVSSKFVTSSRMKTSSSKILQNFQALSKPEFCNDTFKNNGWSMSNFQD